MIPGGNNVKGFCVLGRGPGWSSEAVHETRLLKAGMESCRVIPHLVF